MFAVPLFNPKHVTLVDAVLDMIGPGAFDTNANADAVHPLASLMIMLYDPEFMPE